MAENNKKVVFNSEWDRKFIKESWTFPFGSLMQAYSQLNQGKNTNTNEGMEQFKKDSMELFDLALKMTEEALLRSQQGLDANGQPDVPVDN